MPEERKCPACGSEHTHYLDGAVERSFDSQRCADWHCELPCHLWIKWEQLEHERDEAKKLAEDLAHHRIGVHHGWAKENRRYAYWAHRAGSLEHSTGPAETAMAAIEMLLAAEAEVKRVQHANRSDAGRLHEELINGVVCMRTD
jgi:hypothetical protein